MEWCSHVCWFTFAYMGMMLLQLCAYFGKYIDVTIHLQYSYVKNLQRNVTHWNGNINHLTLSNYFISRL